MHRYQAYNMRAHGPQGNPHRGQGRVLALLKLQSPISQKDLSYLMDMRQQSLSELLAKLEQKGYITRTPSEEDRRTTVIALTEEGRKTAEQTEETELDLNRVFDALSPEEQAGFGSSLDKIAGALEKEMDSLGVDWKRAGGPAGWGRRGRNAPPPPPPHHGHGFGPMHGMFDERRGCMPGGMPGENRFAPEYDGPWPEDFGGPGPRGPEDDETE